MASVDNTGIGNSGGSHMPLGNVVQDVVGNVYDVLHQSKQTMTEGHKDELYDNSNSDMGSDIDSEYEDDVAKSVDDKSDYLDNGIKAGDNHRDNIININRTSDRQSSQDYFDIKQEDRNLKYHNIFLDRRGEKLLVGITDDYIVQFICRTCVVRVIDSHDSEYDSLAQTLK